MEKKLAACGAHESQVVESNPKREGVLDEVLGDENEKNSFSITPYLSVWSDLILC